MVTYYNTLNSEYFKIYEFIIILQKVGGGERRRKTEKGVKGRKVSTEIHKEIYVKDMIKLENHHFVTISVLMI